MIVLAAMMLLWASAGYRIWVTVRSPHALWRTSFTVSTVTVAVAATLQQYRATIDAALHIPNVAGLLVHLVFAVGLAWVHIYLETLRHEHPDPRRVHGHLVVGALAAGVMTLTWAVSPIHVSEYEDLAAAPGHPALVVYHLVFYGYMIISLISIARFCAHEARPRRHAALTRRFSLALIGVACVSSVPVMVLYALGAVLPAATTHPARYSGGSATPSSRGRSWSYRWAFSLCGRCRGALISPWPSAGGARCSPSGSISSPATPTYTWHCMPR